MLTKKTTTLAKSKQLLLLPVLAIAILSFTENGITGDIPTPVRDGNKVTYKGNTFEFESGMADTVMVQDPATGDMQMIITRREPSHPVRMNGEKIYLPGELEHADRTPRGSTEESTLNSQALKEYLLTNMKKEIKKLDDGDYKLIIGAIVIDKKGDIVYFEFDSIEKARTTANGKTEFKIISDKVTETFAKKTASLLQNAPAHTPAVYNGEEVLSAINNTAFWNSFTVKDKEIVAL